jgi:hypothetical protein
MTTRLVVLAAAVTLVGGLGAARVATPAAAAVSAAQVGSYSASVAGIGPWLTFYVSPEGTHIQDVGNVNVSIPCSPGGTVVTSVSIASIPIAADGSFAKTVTQTGLVRNYPATYTYTFRGNLQPAAGNSRAGGAGTFRASVVYTDTVKRTCTTNDRPWTATRDVQPVQTPAPAAPGSYSASVAGVGPWLTFYVSPKGTHVQDVGNVNVGIECSPGGVVVTSVSIPAIPIAGGAFAKTVTQTGLVRNFPATYTYTFQGNFHGAGSNNKARAAGTFRASVVYTDGVKRTCTTNDRPWTANRDVQPIQKAGRLPAGSYSASVAGVGPWLTFAASSNGTRVQNIANTNVGIACSPGGVVVTSVSIPSIPLAADGSFAGTVTQKGLVGNRPATYTYTFRGHYHGFGSNNRARAAGTFRASVVYTDGEKRTCTTNDRPWTATHD